jgi:hypothetical protein
MESDLQVQLPRVPLNCSSHHQYERSSAPAGRATARVRTEVETGRIRQ